MKTITLEKIEQISGGSVRDVADGACAAVGLTAWFGWAVPGLNGMVGACAVYTAGRVTGLI